MVFMSCMHKSKLYSNILFFYNHGGHSYNCYLLTSIIGSIVCVCVFDFIWYWGYYANSLILLNFSVVLQCNLMLLFCVEIVHTNLYNCISWFLARILYLETIWYCISRMWLTSGRASGVKILLQYSSLTLLERECYEGKSNPVGKQTINWWWWCSVIKLCLYYGITV